jgi:2-keto-3-deoxy-L-rhamnonate aldolase RhmA
VDGLIVGPMDLSASIGKLGQLEDAELNAIFDALAAKVVKAGKMLGVSMAYVPERITAWIGRGASFLSLAQDVEILIASLRQIVDTTEKQWQAASDMPMEKRPPRLRGLGADQP